MTSDQPVPPPVSFQRIPPGQRAPARPPLRRSVQNLLERYLDTPRKKKIATLVVLTLILFSYLVFPFIFNRQPQLSAYSGKWNGNSDLRKLAESEGHEVHSIVSTPSLLDMLDRGEDGEIEDTLLIITGVERKYNKDEMEAVLDFVKYGGRLILADDRGFANRISESMGVTFLDGRLYDEEYQRNLSFIETECRGFSLLLNRPSALKTNTGSIWASSSSGNDAFLDQNGNGKGDSDETPEELCNRGSFPLVAKRSRGEGEVVFIADSSLFMNDMLGRAENRGFASFLLSDLLDGNGIVIFEESTHIQSGVYRSTTHFIFYVLLLAGGHPISIIVSLTVLLLALEISIVRQKNPRRWVHTFRTEGKISRLNIPAGHYLRPQVIRQVFLEKVRLQAGMSPEEFGKVTPQFLSQIVKNTQLMDFLHRPGAYQNMQAMKAIVKIARRWSI